MLLRPNPLNACKQVNLGPQGVLSVHMSSDRSLNAESNDTGKGAAKVANHEKYWEQVGDHRTSTFPCDLCPNPMQTHKPIRHTGR